MTTSSPNRFLSGGYKINEDQVSTTIETSLTEIKNNIVGIVEKFTKPLFEQFNFFELSKEVLVDIVDNFVNGKVV